MYFIKFSSIVTPKVICIFVLFILFSCEDPPQDNRKAFQAVLNHFQDPKDSLKLKAAYYLIDNINNHYYHEIIPRRKWEKILDYSDSLIEVEEENYIPKMNEIFNSQGKFTFKKELDDQTISSEDLIINIDLAFKVWNKPWNKHVDFEAFCEFILPYRTKNEPIDISLRSKYLENLSNKLNDSLKFSDILNIVNSFSTYPDHNLITLIPADLSIEDIKKGRMTTCIGESNMVNFKARAIGIPTATDFTIWPNSSGNHYWSVIPYDKDSILYADKDFFFGSPGSYKLRNKIAKIYRYMYSTQEQTSELRIQEKENKTFLQNPNLMDVTSQYIETTDINMDLYNYEGKNFTNAYLCIFNNKKWNPIAFSKVINNKITFNNVGRECIFLIAYLEDNKFIPASNPFSIDKSGEISKYIADESHKRQIHLTRKTKLIKKVIGFGNTLRGAIFQLSKTSDFKNPINIYEISSEDTIVKPREIDLNLDEKYRYARVINDNDVPMHLAEMQLYLKDNKKIKGYIIADEDTPSKNILDDDFLSYATIENHNNNQSWIGLDFGKEHFVDKLLLAPRSDVNYVKPGDTYELLYWDNKWISLGKKIASSYYLDFDEVPDNALLWLSNLSEGVEEELFIYKDNRQHFWNLTDI
ncbi:discoidin domain-containing protein [Zhouia spongiae]|uniref:Discoidin domain-containing protein n=1 Tax=Zhouia spongiae TaxID=2202721 RepID=A0ABY3YKG7_9FLAO|nr:discoidin domain-containing protein [Zhouia spongiae]UNY98299.1 discoidin domain-containing protein [Zhouia spongiae]